ncbi:YhgE/Pip family protein [Granulicatella elegans]|uniref:YhgE/Pip family protein n=1 Tax=Granulicatella elegans TaxID=137732 RepID=UPI001D148F1C|nr:YhgE/Pip family protein [Granulicatella elegans]UEA31773.1 YhgE/Pip domain-containing protein [Granulicatella elegans]
MFREWKAILKKPTFIIVMVGIALIPALYNIIFLSSMWDPYGKLSELPVAVVNKDQAASYNGESMNIGEDMVSNLKDNDALNFHFVTEEEGIEGLEDGTYYMVVTLPSDLSQKAASILTNHPEQMNIDYQTSSGHSFIASKMSDSAMVQLRQTVAKNVTETYAKALFEKMGILKDGMEQASQGSQTLASGSNQLKEGSQQLATNLQTLAQSSVTFSNGAEQFTSGLTTYTDAVKKIDSGVVSFHNGLLTYTGAVSQLDNGLNQLSSKTPELASGIQQLNDGVQAYAGGVVKLDFGLNQLSSGVQAYTSGVDSLSSGASQLAGQSETLRNGVQQLNQGIQQLSSQLEASAQKSSQVSQLAAGLDQLNQAIQSANATGSTALMGEVTNALSTIAASAQSVKENSQAALTAIQSTNAYSTLSAEQQAELTKAVSNQTNTSVQAAKEILLTIQELKENLENAKSQAESVAKLQSAAGQVLPLASTSLTQLTGGIGTLQTAVSQQLVPASQAIQSGVGVYTSGVDKVAQGAKNLSSKNSTLNGSVSQLASGSSQLAKKSSTLTSGVGQLAQKAPELVTNIEKISSGSNQLNQKSSELVSGMTTLQSGTSQLNQKSEQLLSGSSKLTDGSQKIAEGSEKLADGGNTLSTGLETLYDGVTTLSSGLMDANEQLALASTEETNAKTLSNPLALSKTDHDAVAVNGIAMAPYMISVALFVAALSTNMIFAKLPSGRHPETRWVWFKARLEINGIIAVLAGILVYAGVHAIGLTAVHEMKTLFLIVLASITFMAMVTALTTWNSRVGAFFSLILLLLQLASSAGTYPLALTNDFFKSINPWLPMSYSVSGLRQTISMTGTIQEQVIFLIVTLVIFMGLGVIAYRPGVGEE